MLRGCKQQDNSLKRDQVHDRIIYMHLSDAFIYSVTFQHEADHLQEAVLKGI